MKKCKNIKITFLNKNDSVIRLNINYDILFTYNIDYVNRNQMYDITISPTGNCQLQSFAGFEGLKHFITYLHEKDEEILTFLTHIFNQISSATGKDALFLDITTITFEWLNKYIDPEMVIFKVPYTNLTGTSMVALNLNLGYLR